MVNADDKVVFDKGQSEKFTEFEYLLAQVDQLGKVVETHTDIFRENNLTATEIIRAPYYDEDEVIETLAGN